MRKTAEPLKRQLLMVTAVMAVAFSLPAARGAASRSASDSEQQRRFDRISLVLVVNAVEGADMLGVKFYDDLGWEVYGQAHASRRNRSIRSFPSSRIPLSVRVVWRKDPKTIWGTNGGLDYEGEIIGDYTVPVASRIPDEVIKEIRSGGGALRLKFRLKPDGVLFGWDIQRKAPLGDVSVFEMPGGDFLETRY